MGCDKLVLVLMLFLCLRNFTFLLITFIPVTRYFMTQRYNSEKASMLDTLSAVASLTCALPVSLPLEQKQGLYIIYEIIYYALYCQKYRDMCLYTHN